MCTAISFNNYFGRNLDLECGFNERVVVTPQNYNFKMRLVENFKNNYAIIGMAAVVDSIPLYFDATNQTGLSMAGLNFLNNAVYHPFNESKINITPFEFIPFVLGSCKNVADVKKLLLNLNLVNINFSDDLPLSPLHWLISDGINSLTVESVQEGLMVYENKIGVLTNNPPFLMQMENFENYKGLLKAKLPQNDGGIDYSLGIDACGLPGDFSSKSRFVKAAVVKERSPKNLCGMPAVCHFFSMLNSVAMPKGFVLTPTGECEYTRYSSCCDVKNGVYYFKTYDSGKIFKVSMNDYDLKGDCIYVC